MGTSGRGCSFLHEGTNTVISAWPLSTKKFTASWMPRQENTSLFPWLNESTQNTEGANSHLSTPQIRCSPHGHVAPVDHNGPQSVLVHAALLSARRGPRGEGQLHGGAHGLEVASGHQHRHRGHGGPLLGPPAGPDPHQLPEELVRVRVGAEHLLHGQNLSRGVAELVEQVQLGLRVLGARGGVGLPGEHPLTGATGAVWSHEGRRGDPCRGVGVREGQAGGVGYFIPRRGGTRDRHRAHARMWTMKSRSGPVNAKVLVQTPVQTLENRLLPQVLALNPFQMLMFEKCVKV
ncbi:hypothetical protein EYF80_032462 [Liparis tanakae]|uniref:Uncharacterized protein n=1 Tax=Liparis tanakae TaxID=230148 RepID=A0A4Z2GV41_9TELE|nr:hypothetical protein EYF80_032462 [Liparis tanakae]